MIHDALTFPFRGIGRYMLVIGGVLSLLISLATFLPFLDLIIAIGASGYFTAYSFRIINTTAIGKDQACDWPDFRDFWTDLLGPWLCTFATILFSFGPPYIVILLFDPPRFVVIALWIAGFTHMPMAFLSVAINQTMGAAFWTNTIPAIRRCLGEYVILLAILGFLTILNILVKRTISGRPEHTRESKVGPIFHPEEAPGNPGRKESASAGWTIAGIGIVLIVLSIIISIIVELLHNKVGIIHKRTRGKRVF